MRLTIRRPALVASAVVLALAGAPAEPSPLGGRSASAFGHEPRVRIAAARPVTWDPALAGEAASARILLQVFEGLTAFDADSQVEPALASAWQVEDDGRRIVFQLRPGLRYSDGTPLLAEHVVKSWLRLLDPDRPSPLVSLLSDIRGAREYQAGEIGPEDVGLTADGDRVIVEFRRPAAYFLAVTASPSLAVVPPQMHPRLDSGLPRRPVVSGAYVPSERAGAIRLTANPNYWAGVPPLTTIDVRTDLALAEAVSAFQADDVDHTAVLDYDASWIRYDATLGPQLRRAETFSVHYYGFDTTQPPFDDARVRVAFAKAVNWDRVVSLAGSGEPATSLLPPGLPARSEGDFRPAYDPAAARDLLAEAGFASGGEGFPQVELVSFGYGHEAAVAADLEASLGVAVQVESMDFDAYFARLSEDAPAMWTFSWIADYPHPHDFLGVLLETGSASNIGGWSNAEFDAAIEAAAAAADPTEQERHYATAQEIMRDEAPIVPVEYAASWTLSRDGLLGATESGVGMIRFAGLDWTPESGR